MHAKYCEECQGLAASVDNAAPTSHGNLSAAVRAVIEERGAELCDRPPCPPDLNPVEMTYFKFKAHLKRV